MSKKQTAVEYLAQSVIVLGVLSPSEVIKAIQLEREQIEEAFFKGHNDGYNAGVSCYDQVEFQSGDIYYIKTYGECTHKS